MPRGAGHLGDGAGRDSILYSFPINKDITINVLLCLFVIEQVCVDCLREVAGLLSVAVGLHPPPVG